MTKWGQRPHWEFSATYLGRDAHGDWLGIPAGTTMTRPGMDYVAPVAQVGLVPGPGTPVEFELAIAYRHSSPALDAFVAAIRLHAKMIAL